MKKYTLTIALVLVLLADVIMVRYNVILLKGHPSKHVTATPNTDTLTLLKVKPIPPDSFPPLQTQAFMFNPPNDYNHYIIYNINNDSALYIKGDTTQLLKQLIEVLLEQVKHHATLIIDEDTIYMSTYDTIRLSRHDNISRTVNYPIQ